MRLLRLVPILAASLTTACGVYQSSWNCPLPDGTGGCKSIQKTYAFATYKPPIPAPVDPGRLTPPATSGEWVPPVKTIWIAPYVDSAGRRHEPSVLRVVVLPGASIVKPEPEFLIPPVPDPTDDGGVGLPAPPADFGQDKKSSGLGSLGGLMQPKSGAKPNPFAKPSLGTTAPQAPAGGFGIPGLN